MKNVGFDFMARGYSHSLYHMGVQSNRIVDKLYIHESCQYQDAVNNYRGGYIGPSNVSLVTTFSMVFSFIKSLFFSKDRVHICGAHLWQLILLMPFLFFANTTIHLHGQAHSLKKVGVKYLIWYMFSKFSEVIVSNPIWKGPSFVKSMNNFNIIEPMHLVPIKKRKKDCCNLVVYGASGFNIESISSLLESSDLKFESIFYGNDGHKMCNPQILNEALLDASHIYLESVGDYYYFSPSGKLADLVNYNLIGVVKSNCKDIYLYLEYLNKQYEKI
ncbi:hypothetical protein MADA3029_270055 [Vibrio nigripulchritudo MADA3029]|uniref:hypothetical protein n=1 Tax=Vibrio nigripulchritudo TaxID=28173 RepID=UPI0003B238E1|nr:hypothetical protein [Vibrio nigripulchritudo]CCN47619.1 hypothetical protein VIBNIMADA3020_420055 [Vibrio nigripulchritudo MADA3020]CCN56557.1 hypothetical protein VIBNIMADA3021_970052 [Vibrio nigripulchritudo MADA3021]CCN58818.1 hypothetical protein MADA3029_270055 [Vibrio nigripulchritudo MADA3029]